MKSNGLSEVPNRWLSMLRRKLQRKSRTAHEPPTETEIAFRTHSAGRLNFFSFFVTPFQVAEDGGQPSAETRPDSARLRFPKTD